MPATFPKWLSNGFVEHHVGGANRPNPQDTSYVIREEKHDNT